MYATVIFVENLCVSKVLMNCICKNSAEVVNARWLQ